MITCPTSPLLSIRDAVFTVSLQTPFWKFLTPTMPANCRYRSPGGEGACIPNVRSYPSLALSVMGTLLSNWLMGQLALAFSAQSWNCDASMPGTAPRRSR